MVLSDALGELAAIEKLSINTISRAIRTPNVSLLLRIRNLLRDRATHADRDQADWDTTLARWDHHVSGRFAVCGLTGGGLPFCWVKSHQLDGMHIVLHKNKDVLNRPLFQLRPITQPMSMPITKRRLRRELRNSSIRWGFPLYAYRFGGEQ